MVQVNGGRRPRVGLEITFHNVYMGYTNGSSGDSRSAQGTKQKGDKGPPGIGFSLTADEHYHIKNKRITNVSIRSYR